MSDAIDLPSFSAAIAAWVRAGSGFDAAHVWWEFEKRPRPTVPYVALSVRRISAVGYDWTTTDENPLVASFTVTAVDAAANTLTVPNHGLKNGDGPFQFSSTLTLPTPLEINTDYWLIVVDANTLKLAATFEDTGGQMPLGAGNPVTPIDLTTAGTGTISADSTVDTLRAGEEVIQTASGHRVMWVHMECLVAEGGGYDAVRTLENVRAQLELSEYDLDQAGLGLADWNGEVQLLEGRRGSILEPRATWDVAFHIASNFTGFQTIIASIDAEVDLKREDNLTTIPAIPVHVPKP